MRNTKKNISIIVLNIVLVISALFVSLPALAQQEAYVRVDTFAVASTNCTPTSGLQIPKPCDDYSCPKGTPSSDCLKLNPMMQWLIFFINLIASIIGIGAVIMVIVAGLQYTASRDNPQGVQAAKQKLTNVIIGLGAFIFLWAFLQWLIPGGVL